MPIYAKLANAWEDNVTTRVIHDDTWKKPKRIFINDDGEWKTDGFSVPAPLVGLTLVTDTSLAHSSIRVSGSFPATTSSADSVEFDVYSYDSSGSSGSKTFVQTKTVPIPPEGSAETIIALITGLSATTKYSVEGFVVNAGVRSDPSPELRVQTGKPATYTDVPVYGWGAQTGWVNPATNGFIVSSNRPAVGSGNAASYITDTTGKYFASAATWGPITPVSSLFGQALSPPNQMLGYFGPSWSGYPFVRVQSNPAYRSTSVRIDAMYIAWRALVGKPNPNPWGVVSFGAAWFRLRASSSGDLGDNYLAARNAGTAADHNGTMKIVSGGEYWGVSQSTSKKKTDLGFTLGPGSYIDIAQILVPIMWFTNAEGGVSRYTASHLQIKIRNWVVTSYNTVVATPKVEPSVW